MEQPEILRLASEYFSVRRLRTADKLPKLFNFLVDHLNCDAHRGIAWRTVFEGVYGFPPEDKAGDKKGDARAALRKLKDDLDTHLKEFAASEDGRRQPVTFVLQPKIYKLIAIFRDVSVKKFWKPYLDASIPTLIVYTESLFFRSVEGRFFLRHLDVNPRRPGLLTADIHDKCKFLPPKDKLPLQPIHHWVSAGEANAVIQLTRWFERNGVDVEHSVSHSTKLFGPAQTPRNLILFGNSRTFPDLSKLLADGNCNFRMASDHIKNLSPQPADKARTDKSKKTYKDEFTEDAKTAVGLVARFFDEQLGVWVTIFASHSGPFFEGSVRQLLSEPGAQKILTWMNGNPGEDPPPKFELLLSVKVDETERVEFGYPVDPLAKRAEKPSARSKKVGGT